MEEQEKTAFAEETLLKCKGYIPAFIHGVTISHKSILSESQKKLLPKVEGNNEGILNYTNLSVLYDSQRKVPFFSAYNIDGAAAHHADRAGHFHPEPRISSDLQLSQKGFYDLRVKELVFEIGHMAANHEMGWGDDGQLKAFQTFFFTNSTPQAKNLNIGLWKTLESYIIKEATEDESGKKICVFTGPLLQSNDPAYVKMTSFKIPLLFFKVIVFKNSKGIFSTAFLISHEQKLLEEKVFVKAPKPTTLEFIKKEGNPFEDFPYKKVFQVNIPFLEKHSGLTFKWSGVKQITLPPEKNQFMEIMAIKDARDAANKSKLLAPIDETFTLEKLKSKETKLNIQLS